MREIEVEVKVDTDQMDDAIEKADELVEILGKTPPQISIHRPKGCTFNITIYSENR